MTMTIKNNASNNINAFNATPAFLGTSNTTTEGQPNPLSIADPTDTQKLFASLTGAQAGSSTGLPTTRLGQDDLSGFQNGLRTLHVGGSRVASRGGTRAQRIRTPNARIVQQFSGLDRRQQLGYLDRLQRRQPREYKAIIDNIRAGNITDKKVAMPIAVHMACNTSYGKGAGRAYTYRLREMFDLGRVQFGPVAHGHDAVTTPDSSRYANARNCVRSTITVNDKLLGSPEALATILTHESVHAENYATGNRQMDMDEELAGIIAGAYTWDCFGQEKFNSTSAEANKSIQNIEAYQQSFDPNNTAGIRLEVTSNYAYNYVVEKDFPRAMDTLRQIVKDGFDPYAGGTQKQAEKIYIVVTHLYNNDKRLANDPTFRRLYSGLKPRVPSEWHLR